MTRDERRKLFARLDAATSTDTGLSPLEREKQVQFVYLKCIEAKELGNLAVRYSPEKRELVRALRGSA